MAIAPPKQINHRRYWIFFLVALLVMAVIVNLCLRSVKNEMIRETVSTRIDKLSSAVLLDILDIEDGVRGLLVESDQRFLQPYFEGRLRIGSDLHELQDISSGDNFHGPKVSEISDLCHILMTEFSNQVSLFTSEGIGPAKGRFHEFPTKPSMDRVRYLVALVKWEEEKRLDRNLNELKIKINTTIILLDGFTIVIVFLSLAMISGFLAVPIRTEPSSP